MEIRLIIVDLKIHMLCPWQEVEQKVENNLPSKQVNSGFSRFLSMEAAERFCVIYLQGWGNKHDYLLQSRIFISFHLIQYKILQPSLCLTQTFNTNSRLLGNLISFELEDRKHWILLQKCSFSKLTPRPVTYPPWLLPNGARLSQSKSQGSLLPKKCPESTRVWVV